MVLDKKIGLVILNYKDAETTKQLCENVMKYTALDHIVIVDNCSPDDSYEKLKVLQTDKVDVIKTSTNGGYSSGNNIGAFHLIFEYSVDVIFIANPDVCFSEYFVEAIASLIINKKATAASGKMLNLDGSCGFKRKKINGFKEDLLDCLVILQNRFGMYRDENIYENSGIVEVEYLPGSLFAIDSSAFKCVNGFDENVFLYCEERILGKKLLDKKMKMIMDYDTSFLHAHSVTINKVISPLKQFMQLYKSRLYYWKNYSSVSIFSIILLEIFMIYGLCARQIIYLIHKILHS